MKKTLSLVLTLAMLSSLVLALFVGVGAAKDGDVLWEANFSGADANFKPELFASDATNKDNVPVISNDGKSIEWTFTETEKGRYRWGDVVEELKVTADTRYTVYAEYKAFSPKSNGGLAFVAGGSLEKVKAGEAGWCTMYGRTNSTFSFYRTEEGNYSQVGWNAHNGAADENGYVTFKIELYGYNIRIYTKQADGSYAYAYSCAVPEADRANAAIACGIYTWVNVDAVDVVGIRSFKVLQGCPLTEAILKTKLSEGLANAYKNAKKGDLVYSANFNGDDYFKPTLSTTNNSRAEGNTFDVTADGKALTFKGHKFGTDEKVQAALWYASPIKGLDVTADTEYTIEFKAKGEGSQYGGAIFYATADFLPKSYISFYGPLNESNSSWTIAKGSDTSNYTGYGQMEKKYLNYDARVLDGEYWDLKVEIDGYDVTVYCKTAEGYSEVVSYTIDDVNITLAAGVYNYESKGGMSVKDFNVYKGLTVSNDYTNVPEEPVVPDVPTGDASLLLAIVAVISLGGVMIAKKAR